MSVITPSAGATYGSSTGRCIFSLYRTCPSLLNVLLAHSRKGRMLGLLDEFLDWQALLIHSDAPSHGCDHPHP